MDRVKRTSGGSYKHYCLIANTLDTVGEKWAVLIVRDLLRGPHRFTDLIGYLNDITPKMLTQRLRKLEFEGIVERDTEPGRREVWYRLTRKGRDLAPVVQSLAAWGVKYAMREPEPGEAVHPEHLMHGLALYLNAASVHLPHEVVWLVRFTDVGELTLWYDRERWRIKVPDRAPDVVIQATVKEWVRILATPQGERRDALSRLPIEGDPSNVDAFVNAASLI